MRLGDPCNDRVMKEVQPPFVGLLEDSQVFPIAGQPDWQLIMELFRGGGSLSKAQAMIILTSSLY